MNFKKVIFLFFISILITVSNISYVYATNYILDFENTLIDGNQNNVNTDSVAVDKSLAVKVTIANPNNFWIKIDSLWWTVKSKKNNDDFDVIVKQKYDVDTNTKPITEIVIPPNSKINVYIILEEYNLLEDDMRIGSWLIDFDEQLEGVKYFNEDNFNVINLRQTDLKTSKGNLVLFTVTKEPVKIYNIGFLKYIPGLEDVNPYLNFIVSIIVIVGGVWGIIKWFKN